MNESVQQWLNEFSAKPTETLQRLVLGQAGVPAWSRATLREIFLEVFQSHAEFLDNALEDWLRTRLMQLPPERTPLEVWATTRDATMPASLAVVSPPPISSGRRIGRWPMTL